MVSIVAKSKVAMLPLLGICNAPYVSDEACVVEPTIAEPVID